MERSPGDHSYPKGHSRRIFPRLAQAGAAAAVGTVIGLVSAGAIQPEQATTIQTEAGPVTMCPNGTQYVEVTQPLWPAGYQGEATPEDALAAALSDLDIDLPSTAPLAIAGHSEDAVVTVDLSSQGIIILRGVLDRSDSGFILSTIYTCSGMDYQRIEY